MKILYLHGYGSAYKPDSDKVIALKALGSVSGINLNYGHGPATCIDAAIKACQDSKIDLIVGTSMGGWLASHTGARYGKPFVALNPAVNPAHSLKQHAGKSVNYGTDTDRTIDADTVALYPPFAMNGSGIVLCEEGDDIIIPADTAKALQSHYPIHLIPGGSHRFESLPDQLGIIKQFLIDANTKGKHPA